MHQSHRLGLIAGALALTSVLAFADNTQAPAAAPAAPITGPIVVNGQTISKDRFEFLMREMTNAGQQDTPELRENVRKNLIVTAVLAQEAVKQGVEKDAEVEARLEMSRQSVLARGLVMQYLKKNPVSDDQVKALYEKEKPKMTSRETKLRHILVKDEKQANKILAELKKGKKFEELADKYTEDPSGKGQGGDLGWVNLERVNFDPAFLAGVTPLSKGQITPKAVKSSFGYHIIQKQDERENAPPLAQLEPQLKRQLESEIVEKYIETLRAKADIK